MKTFDILYARNSNGKINQWAIGVQDDGPKVVIWEGILDGQLTRSERPCKAKNLGKMNESTAYEQGCLDAQSRWKKKKKQGYKSLIDLDIVFIEQLQLYQNSLFQRGVDIQHILEWTLPKNRTDANNLSKPMKAMPYFKDDGSVRIQFPCFGQPKLNGFRVMARWEKVIEGDGMFATEVEKVVFRSKEGLRYDILEHIEKEFKKQYFLMIDAKNNGEAIHNLVFDGEIYIHNEILSEISSAIRKRNSKTEKLTFHIFDVAIENLSQKDRIRIIQNLSTILDQNIVIRIVTTTTINTNEEAQITTDNWIKLGYEGGIFRDMKATYQFGERPQTMVKLKRSQDKEFYIIDVVGGDNSPDLGIFVCRAENGEHFKCTPEGSHDIKREYLSNKQNYIGKMLTVRFFERTKDNLPFHAIGVAIRDYE